MFVFHFLVLQYLFLFNSTLNYQRSDEALSQDIDELLAELENNNVSRNFKEEHKKTLQSVALRLVDVFNKQKELMSDDIEQRKMHIAVAAAAVAGSQDTNATKTHLSLAEAMLHKKINSLTKQLEVADQKSRYVTMQWQADKAKFKETLDSKKSEMDELGHRLAVMEVRTYIVLFRYIAQVHYYLNVFCIE